LFIVVVYMPEGAWGNRLRFLQSRARGRSAPQRSKKRTGVGAPNRGRGGEAHRKNIAHWGESYIYTSRSCVISSALTTINPIAGRSAGVNEPSGLLSASMINTNTTDACPNSWIRPFDVPSGVG